MRLLLVDSPWHTKRRSVDLYVNNLDPDRTDRIRSDLTAVVAFRNPITDRAYYRRHDYKSAP